MNTLPPHPRRLGVVMDPIGAIKPSKDTTLALLLAAQARGWALCYFELGDIWLDGGVAMGRARALSVRDDAADWFSLGEAEVLPLGSLHTILMRKDPPFDTEFVYATYILERAEAAGAQVVNRPRGLRDANEKAFTSWFAEFTPPTRIARGRREFDSFRAEHREIIAKPLDGMGGSSIFRIRPDDPNASVIWETLSDHGRRYIVLQRYLPAIADGDKRVLLIDGEPVEYTLARIPPPGESRGNLAAGGRGEVREITEAERRIAAAVGPVLRERGLRLVGLDVIGEHLTEINVTSPTCVREIEAATGLDIAGRLIDALDRP